MFFGHTESCKRARSDGACGGFVLRSRCNIPFEFPHELLEVAVATLLSTSPYLSLDLIALWRRSSRGAMHVPVSTA